MTIYHRMTEFLKLRCISGNKVEIHGAVLKNKGDEFFFEREDKKYPLNSLTEKQLKKICREIVK